MSWNCFLICISIACQRRNGVKSTKSSGNGEVVVHPNGRVGERQPQFPLCSALLPLYPGKQGVLHTHSNLMSSISSGPASALTTGLGQEQDPLSPPQPRAFPSSTSAPCRSPSPSPCRLPPKKRLLFQGLPFCNLTEASISCLPRLDHVLHGDCRSEN